MPNTIRKVSYAYVTAASKPGEAARILQALRDANVNLLAFSGFPQGRNKAQIDVVTDDLDALKGVARGRKWRLSRIKRAFLVQGTDEAGAAVGPLARLGRSEEHTSELQSQSNLVCRLLLDKKQPRSSPPVPEGCRRGFSAHGDWPRPRTARSTEAHTGSQSRRYY